MGVTHVRTCDTPGCEATTDVTTVTVAVGRKAWEVDLCGDCRTYWLSELEAVSRRATRTSLRKRATFTRTELSKANL